MDLFAHPGHALSLSLSPPTSHLSPPWVLAFCGVKTQALEWGRGMPSYLLPQGWALFKTRDFHHLKAVQLACERYGGRGGERGRDRLVMARQESCQGEGGSGTCFESASPAGR